MRLLDVAGERGSGLVVLPEVWTGLGYSSKVAHRSIAEEIPGPTTNLLAEKARRYGMTIIGSMYEKVGERYYNSSPVVGPDGRILGKYWKSHLFDAPNRSDIPSGIRESDRVSAGDQLSVFQTTVGPIGVSVCSDLRFPEVYRELALKGAKVIVCASAFLSPRFDHWEFFLRARAAENQCWVVASGQVGVEPKSGDCVRRPQHDRRSMGRHRGHRPRHGMLHYHRDRPRLYRRGEAPLSSHGAASARALRQYRASQSTDFPET